MITCQNCKTRFRADYTQGYPGHADPPSSLLAYATLFLIAAAITAIMSLFILRTFMYVLAGSLITGAAVSLMHVPEAREVCDRTGGGTCPSCGHKNPVRWYS